MLLSAATSRKSPSGPAFYGGPVTRSLCGHLALFTHWFDLRWPISDNRFQVFFLGEEESGSVAAAAADTAAPGAAEVGNAATPAAGAKPPPGESENPDSLNTQIHKNTQLQLKEGEARVRKSGLAVGVERRQRDIILSGASSRAVSHGRAPLLMCS